MKGINDIMNKKLLIFVITNLLIQFNYAIYADSYQEGLKLYEQGKYTEAIDKFKISIQDSSADKEDIHLFIGNCYLKLGEDEHAIKEYAIAKEFKENREAVYSNLTILYFGNDDLENAFINCEKLLNENPNSPVHNWLMGQIYLEKNEVEKAKECFNKSIEVSDKSYLAYFSLGNIYVTEKDYKKAYEYFKKTIEIREDYVAGYKNIIAFIPEEIIPVEEHKRILTKYLVLNPSDAQAKQKLEKLEKGDPKTNQAKGTVD